MPGSPPAEVEFTDAEEWAVRAWREKQMLAACEGDIRVSLALLGAGADYHVIEKARRAGLRVDQLVEFFG